MNPKALVVAFLLLAQVAAARAHQLDEYLQATFIAVERNQLRVDVFLTPGLNVLPAVLAQIDSDGDGAFSADEQRRYAQRVVQDLAFAIGGVSLAPELAGFEFPSAEQLRDGRGDIHLELVIKLSSPKGAARFRFENRHLRPLAAYQVNCLASRDPIIRIGEQHRDSLQAVYEVGVTFAP
jgi:hypothetical protein